MSIIISTAIIVLLVVTLAVTAINLKRMIEQYKDACDKREYYRKALTRHGRRVFEEAV